MKFTNLLETFKKNSGNSVERKREKEVPYHYLVHIRRDPLGIITFQMTCVSFTTLAGGQFNNACIYKLDLAQC